MASLRVPGTGDGESRIRKTRRGTRPSLSPQNGGLVSSSSGRDRKRPAQKKIVKLLVHLRREGRRGRATETERMMLAMSWGADQQGAKKWARSPGAAATWPWDALALASGLGSSLDDLERFVAEVDRDVERAMPRRGSRRKVQRTSRRDVTLTFKQLKGTKTAGTKKSQVRRKKPKRQSVPGPVVVVRRSELPRLRGAQKPPRKLDLTPEVPNPNRPAGYSTTDWINSKS